jgi:predicted dehydrogenase
MSRRRGNRMDYDLGVVGLGHWFSWLEKGLGEGKGLDLKKAVGTRPYDDKKSLLESFGIGRENYFISDRDGNIPIKFFEELYLVHISDPNKFHAAQAVESLKNGKHVIVEKTIASNKREFDGIVSYVKENNLQDKLYLHLHYLHKQAAIGLKGAVPGLVSEYGRIKSVDATFFEPVNDEDPKSTWVLDMENGGLFMDWIHPFEVVFYSTDCTFGRILDVKDFVVNADYSTRNPTGVESVIALHGKNYMENATITTRVAKGTDARFAKKEITLRFESGVDAVLSFPGHESEFNEATKRGKLDIVRDGKPIYTETFSGPNSSEIFIKEIFEFCEGRHPGLKLEEIAEIFKPQWEYQNMARSLITETKKVNEFLFKG